MARLLPWNQPAGSPDRIGVAAIPGAIAYLRETDLDSKLKVLNTRSRPTPITRSLTELRGARLPLELMLPAHLQLAHALARTPKCEPISLRRASLRGRPASGAPG